ncbi:MAG: hypothetical protein AAGN66_05455 [Acidobacteriota bacterium]
MSKNLKCFDRAIEAIRRRFPSLRIEVGTNADRDPVAEIPSQDGLDFDVTISQQNDDELHLETAGFHSEWFPCAEADKFDDFLEAAGGLLGGRYRVLETLAGKTVIESHLQRPEKSGSWTAIATWSSLQALIPGIRRQRVVRNQGWD